MEIKPNTKSEQTGMTSADRITYLLAEYKYIGVGLAIASTLVLIYYNPDLPTWNDIPRSIRILIVAVPGGMALGYIPARYIVNRYFQSRKIIVNEIDASRGGDHSPDKMGVARKYAVPPAIWTDKKIKSGKIYQNYDGEYVVQKLKYEDGELELTGPWKGEKTDTELETYYHALDETRGRQRFYSEIGKTLKMRLPSWLRSMEQEVIEKVTTMTIEQTTDSIDQYNSTIINDAKTSVESIDAPEGYYSDEFRSEIEAEIEESIQTETEETEQ